MDQENLLEMIVSFSASMDQQEYADWNLTILEIICGILTGRNPLDLNTERTPKVLILILLGKYIKRTFINSEKTSQQQKTFSIWWSI